MLRLRQGFLLDLPLLLLTELVKPLPELGAMAAQDRHGEQRRIDGARLADGQSTHGNAAGHLHGGEKRVHALEGRALDGHAEHRQDGVGGHHARQMRGPARGRDDDLDAAAFGPRRVLRRQGGRAMGGHDLALVGDAEAGEDLVGMAHGLPVGLAAHDDSDERLTGIAHKPETHDDAAIAVSQALSGLGQFARKCSPATRWTWSSASPVGYALRTPTHSAMFRGARKKGSVVSMAIAIRSNSQISYPILSAGAFTATLAVHEIGPADAPKPRLLDRVREAIRGRHYSHRTEKAYVHWIKRYIFFHGKRHPAEMGAP